MARIYGSNKILGTIGGVRHYKLPGCDFIIAAEKGGANGNLIKNNPAFARTRENNEEWKGITLSAKHVKWALGQYTASVVNRFLIGSLNKAMSVALRRDPVLRLPPPAQGAGQSGKDLQHIRPSDVAK